MKRIIKITSITVFAFLLVLLLVSCSKEDKSTSDAWEGALYTADTELGEGERAVKLEVAAYGKSVNFTVHTNADTVGEALLEHDLIAGDMGDYGMYIKRVNGILADYDVDGTYWAFYINGEYAMTGVDSTAIDPDAEYKLERTK